MTSKASVNQRVRDLIAHFGYSENVHGFAVDLLNWERSDKLRNVVTDKTVASTEMLVEITNSVVSKKGEKPNGHWLLTGEGSMFLGEKTEGSEKNLISQYIDQISALTNANLINAETIANLTRLLSAKVTDQGKQDVSLAQNVVPAR